MRDYAEEVILPIIKYFFNTLITKSIWLTYTQRKEQELKNINNNKSYLQCQENLQRTPEEPTQIRPQNHSPYIKGTSDQIGKIFRKHNIQNISKPLQTIGSSLRNPKDKIPLENLSYSVIN